MSFYFFLSLVSCSGDKITTNSIDTDQVDTAVSSNGEPGTEDLDTDGDGYLDDEDACPEDALQWSDADGDGICDEIDDACPEDPLQWIDSDGDGYCDADDGCPEDAEGWYDDDGDGYCNNTDACPENPFEWSDADGDGVCDGEDDCPDDMMGAIDSNGDGVCDENDDTDGDGISDGEEMNYGEDCAKSNPAVADTDEDGILDAQDPYPRDPWPEFILFRNDDGRIDLMLSNRDGTFEPPIQIGHVHGSTSDTAYRYTSFSISDYDGNGRMDFLAVGDSDPSDNANDLDIWWFWREKADEFNQVLLGSWPRVPFQTVADFDNDEWMDNVVQEVDRPNNISDVTLRFYQNQGNIQNADCVATDDPLNPDNCAFVTSEAVVLGSWIANQWQYRQSKTAVDVGGDGIRDIAVGKIANGSNTTTPITVLYGNGDGTFSAPPPSPLLVHNNGSCGGSPSNSLLFADFDNNQVGDIVTGLDDDGDAGSAWFYPGDTSSGNYLVDSSSCVEAFDLNPAAESGAENYGVSTSAIPFDFDFDGIQDIMVGFNYTQPWNPPSKTVLLFGVGDGTFEPPITIREFPNSNYGNRFAVPQMMCPRFPL